jgi:hypothetical protein
VADGVELTITNEAGFRSFLAGLVDHLRDARPQLDAVGAPLTADARAVAPEDTGRLAGAHSGSYVGENRYRIVVDTPYAAAIHWGWPAHGIHRRPWIVATFRRNEDRYIDAMADAEQQALDREAGKT